MDSVAREYSSEAVEMFRYRKVISIPPMGMIDDLVSIAYSGFHSVLINATIDAKLSLKKLEIHKKKSIKLHISKDLQSKVKRSSNLKVQGFDMSESTEETYIGDVITDDGSNNKNIARRRQIGYGAISSIFAILNTISKGYQYIEIGLIFRESVLISKMLLSCEAWHKVYKYQIEKLEEVDKSYLRKLLNGHSKTPIEFIFSDAGCIPLRFVISYRRLMYWWHIMQLDKSELVYRVYAAQKTCPVIGDWVNLLEVDKQEFGIYLSDEEISQISKYKMKTMLKEKVCEVTVRYLNKLKSKHSKSVGVHFTAGSVAPYLTDERFSQSERELLFKLRSKTLFVKENFSHLYDGSSMLCDLCNLFPCTQKHVLQCPELSTSLIIDKSIQVDESDIYSDVDKQLLYVKIFKSFWDLRTQRIG